jgi:hypothetical protein
MRTRCCTWLLVAALAAGSPLNTSSQAPTPDLLTATVGEIQAAVQSGALSYERLVRLSLARIDSTPEMPELELNGVEGFDTGACIARVRRQQHQRPCSSR